MKWLPDFIPVKLNSPEVPTATLVSLDLEYEETGNNVVMVGIFDGNTYWSYTDPHIILDGVLLDYLHSVNWITQDGIHAELKVLNKLYGGFRPEQIVFDVKIMGYVFDSTLKDWGLKNMAKKYLNVEWPKYSELKKEYKFKSIKELPQEVLVDYNGSDCYYTWKLWEYYRKNFTAQQWEFYRKIELPTNHLLSRVEAEGVLIDPEKTAELHEHYLRRRNGWDNAFRQQLKKRVSLDAWKKEVAQYYTKSKSYENITFETLNVNSWRHVKAVLWCLGYKVKDTEEDTVKKYGDDKVVKCLLEYRGHEKICTTYTSVIFEESKKSGDGRIRSRFTQSTITGRLASSDPINLQNQPQEIRACYVAKEGHAFVEADWSNLEWRIPGHFSGDPAIIEELSKRNGDIHKQTAKLMFGQSPTEEHRRVAKTCNFLLTNSGRAKRLAQELNCSYREAEDIYNRFWKGYSTLANWTKETKSSACRDKGVQTMFGRWVSLPGLQAWCGRSNCPVVGRDYFCKECFKKEETEREAVSIRVQGSGADLIKLAMLRLYREYKYVPVLTVHDSILVEVPDSEVEIASSRIKEIMETVVSLKVPLFCEVGVGKNWGEC